MRELPRGTVTFLFTDIEGSTRRLHELGGEAYAAELATHRRVVRDACARHGGVEVDTQGDAFFIAFSSASSAVAAAAEATGVLATGPTRVRMGLHTGVPHVTEEGYVGEDVHLGARIAAAGHGNQVLLSQATRNLVDVALLDLGEHRLKDFVEPVALYQLGGQHFPPLKTISNTNLPRIASSFVGRDREIAEVMSLLAGTARLVTLVGPGGSGKTRLALEAAAELLSEFKNGVFWVPLATLRDSALVLETIAQTLGAKELLANFIGERELLLVLDNAEQVVAAAADLAGLVESCPNLRLLVTTRERLRVRGEVHFEVSPLSESEAVQLFCTRSRLEPDAAIAELCRRLDNLPLAVELAAARASVLSPPEILARLSRRLDVLKGGRDSDARQYTLRAAIAWSYDLLAPEERELFASLAIFSGGWTLAAAEEVAGADLDVLQSLMDKSLVWRTGDRFGMLETICEFASETLTARGDSGDLRVRHADYFLRTVRDAERSLRGPGQLAWLSRLDPEVANLRVAFNTLLDHNLETAGQFAAALWWFWDVRGHVKEARRQLERVLTARSSRAAPANVMGAAAWFAYRAGDLDEADALGARALAAAPRISPEASIALGTRGAVALIRGRLEEAWRLSEEAVAVAREGGFTWELSLALNDLAMIATEQGDDERALELYDEAAQLLRDVGDSRPLSILLNNRAEVSRSRGDYGEAERLLSEARVIATDFRDTQFSLHILMALAGLRLLRGDVAGAESTLGEAADHYLVIGDNVLLANLLGHYAGVAAARNEPEHATRFIAAGKKLADGLGVAASRWDLEITERLVARIRATLPSERFAAAWKIGQSLDPQDALNEARAVFSHPDARPQPSAGATE